MKRSQIFTGVLLCVALAVALLMFRSKTTYGAGTQLSTTAPTASVSPSPTQISTSSLVSVDDQSGTSTEQGTTQGTNQNVISSNNGIPDNTYTDFCED